MFKYAGKNINKWLSNNIQLHFIMKYFNMTQRRVLCPHNHLLKTTTTGDIRELSSCRPCIRCIRWGADALTRRRAFGMSGRLQSIVKHMILGVG